MLSSFLFLIPFFYPCLSPVLFFCWMPLFYSSLVGRKFRFLNGFCWGVLIFSAHLFWLLMMSLNNSNFIFGSIFWILILLQMAFFSGLWFFFQNKFERYVGTIVSWLISTVGFVYFIIYGSIFLAGRFEGYTLFNPFILIAYYPQLLSTLSYFGVAGLLFFLVGFQIFFVAGVVRNRLYLLFSFICLFPFLIGFSQEHLQANLQIHGVTFLKPTWLSLKSSVAASSEMGQQVNILLHKNRQIDFVLMPESSFNFNLLENENIIKELSDYSPDSSILFGCQEKIGEKYFNSFVQIRDGEIIFDYKKKHLMPFVERVPAYFSVIGNIFIKDIDQFSYPEQSDDILEINGQLLQIFICSELFFETKKVKGYPILFLANDVWFQFDYVKKLVPLFIKYFSILYQQPVIYGTVSGQNNIN